MDKRQLYKPRKLTKNDTGHLFNEGYLAMVLNKQDKMYSQVGRIVEGDSLNHIVLVFDNLSYNKVDKVQKKLFTNRRVYSAAELLSVVPVEEEDHE